MGEENRSYYYWDMPQPKQVVTGKGRNKVANRRKARAAKAARKRNRRLS